MRIVRRGSMARNFDGSSPYFGCFPRCTSLLSRLLPIVDHRGYSPNPAHSPSVRKGMPQDGSRSNAGLALDDRKRQRTRRQLLLHFLTTQSRAFLTPKELSAARLSRSDLRPERSSAQLRASMALKTGKIIEINGRPTPSGGRELTMLQQIFSDLGLPGPGGTITPGGPPWNDARSRPLGQPQCLPVDA